MNEFLEKAKGYLIAFLALAGGLFYALFRGQQRKTAEAEANLAKATFKLTTQENDQKYEAAKNSADDLVAEYKRSRTDKP